MNNHVIGFSVSALLHGCIVLLAVVFTPSPMPLQRTVPLTLAMFEIPPPAALEPKRVVTPAPRPAPERAIVPVPRAKPVRPARPKPKARPRTSDPAPPVARRAPEPPAVKAPPVPARPAPAPEPAPPPAQARTSEPAKTVPAAPPDPMAVASYADALASRIARYRAYPRQAQLRGWQGEVELQLRIAPNGELVDARISRSSGFSVLDRQALEMAQQAQPLPLPPPALRRQELTVVVPVAFRLRS